MLKQGSNPPSPSAPRIRRMTRRPPTPSGPTGPANECAVAEFGVDNISDRME
jgi:hypothetical protein